MPHTQRLPLIAFLRAAADESLEYGWLYLPSNATPNLDTPCLLVMDEKDPQSLAVENGFPQEGLDTDDLTATAQCAMQFQSPPSDDLLLESFVYYWRNDAWLPEPGAAEPPPWEEAEKIIYRKFYDLLGDERKDVPCKKGDCGRGAVKGSVFCRPHHFEMIMGKICPFDD